MLTDKISELTLEEKCAIVRGSDFLRNHGVERLDIPRLKVTDGPHGTRGRSFAGTPAVWFPCDTALAATWDVDLIFQVGEALGEQVKSKGASMLLGPTMNIHRTPIAGRNFECFSEDPYLTSRMAVAYITGLQSRGVDACGKHFVCNDQEHERMAISSEVDERTLREIYLPPFEASVKEAETWWVMSAYNALNGTFCAENGRLLNDILREEWGFGGGVISDWWGTKSIASANAGLDLEMPSPGMNFMGLPDAVRSAEVDEAVVDEKVHRILETIDRSGITDTDTETALDRPEDRALVRRTAADAMVVLRNEGDVLPLRDAKTIAVIGPNAYEGYIGGGGSSEVTPHYRVTPVDGIRAHTRANVTYALGCTGHKILPELPLRLLDDGLTLTFLDDVDMNGDVIGAENIQRFRLRWLGDSPVEASRWSARIEGTFTPDRTGTWTFSLISAGVCNLYIDDQQVVENWESLQRGDTFFGIGSLEQFGTIDLEEGKPVRLRVDFSTRSSVSAIYIGCLPPVPDDSIAEAATAAAAADAAVVVVGLNSDWEAEGYDRDGMDLPGDQDALVSAVAAAQPNTVVVLNVGSPVHMPWADDVPAIVQAWYAGQEWGNALADVLFGTVTPSGKLPTTIPVRYDDNPTAGDPEMYPGVGGKVVYKEGVFVGYRHYDSRGVEPRYPFGHGLSYTSFEYGELRVEGDVASIEVTNTGDVAGAEIVQLYVHDVEASVERPEQELKGFAKLHLEPGETGTATFRLDQRTFSFWGPDGWTAEPGTFELRAGASSRDIRATAHVDR